MGHAENKVDWCIRKAEKEGARHRGIRVIEPNAPLAEKHIAKAGHNLKTMLLLIKGGSLDWAITASFYSLYHCCLAIIAAFGYESRNQECTFAAIEHLIAEQRVALPLEQLRRISTLDRSRVVTSDGVIELREDAQYGTDTVFDAKQVDALRQETATFLELAKRILEEK
jgi:uncharacterized protein (UPF0332 family)